MTDTRIITDLSESDYHAHTAIGSSTIRKFAESRRDCESLLNGDKTVKVTRKMDVGSAVDCALLTPRDWQSRFVLFPDSLLSGPNKSISSNEAKACRDEQLAAGKVPLKQSEFLHAKAACEKVFSSPIGELILKGEPQLSLFWSFGGMEFKGRLDCRLDHTIFDLKCSERVSPREHKKQVKNLRYWIQAAHYVEGLIACDPSIRVSQLRWLWVVVQPTPPYTMAVHELSGESLVRARSKWEEIADDFVACHKSGDWSEPWEGDVNPMNLEEGEMWYDAA